MGRPTAFIAAGLLILAWLISGPMFHFSDTWQLIINTTTTIVTFLMVFLIQNSQNRDTRAIQLKLDELLRALKSARTELVGLEDVPDEELDKLQHDFARIAASGKLQARRAKGGKNRNTKAVSDKAAS